MKKVIISGGILIACLIIGIASLLLLNNKLADDNDLLDEQWDLIDAFEKICLN